MAALTAGAVLVTGALGAATIRVDELESRASGPAGSSGAELMRADEPSAAELAEMERRLGTPAHVDRANRRRARRLAEMRAERRRARARAARRERERERRRAAAGAEPDAPYWWDDDAAKVPGTPPAEDARQWIQSGRGAWLDNSGLARPPANAPAAIKRVIYAGNSVARAPYLWGGGHGQWRDKGYDCSGSVSYALAAGGMLSASRTSGQLMRWGSRGAGRWLTVYAQEGHVFMVVAGLRFDTSGARTSGSRWQLAPRSAAGYRVRHWPGL